MITINVYADNAGLLDSKLVIRRVAGQFELYFYGGLLPNGEESACYNTLTEALDEAAWLIEDYIACRGVIA